MLKGFGRDGLDDTFWKGVILIYNLKVEITKYLIEKCPKEILQSFIELEIFPIEIEYKDITDRYQYTFNVNDFLIEKFKIRPNEDGEFYANIVIEHFPKDKDKKFYLITAGWGGLVETFWKEGYWKGISPFLFFEGAVEWFEWNGLGGEFFKRKVWVGVWVEDLSEMIWVERFGWSNLDGVISTNQFHFKMEGAVEWFEWNGLGGEFYEG